MLLTRLIGRTIRKAKAFAILARAQPSSTILQTLGLLLVAPLAAGYAPSASAAGDPAAGQKVFETHCAGCHATSPGVNKIGPPLVGIVGSKSGSVPGYNFSAALKNANITWDETTLDKYLQNPTAFVHGTKMAVPLPSAQDRQNVIAYLETLKS